MICDKPSDTRNPLTGRMSVHRNSTRSSTMLSTPTATAEAAKPQMNAIAPPGATTKTTYAPSVMKSP